MARRGRRTSALVALALIVPALASAYSGSLWSTDGGIAGTGNWIVTGPTWIQWDVTQNPDSSWHYWYEFGHPEGATSHFILEVSSSFAASDIFNESGDFHVLEGPKLQRPGSGNPEMPEALFGLRFDEASGLTSYFEFDSSRGPMWGDFYAKNGTAGGYGLNTARNAGFTASDWDPLAPIASGAYEHHLLVPDTQEPPPIPEPSTLLLLGTGLAGAVAVVRRRR